MVVQESFFRDIARLIIWYPVRWLVKIIPITWSIYLFRGFGKLHARLSKGRKEHLIQQYQLIGNAHNAPIPPNQFVEEYLAAHYLNQLAIFFSPKLDKNNISRYHSFSGLEELERALTKNQGAILLHAHFGPAQLTLVGLGLQGYQTLQIGLPTDTGLSWIGRKVAYRLRLKEEAKIPARIVAADSFLRPVVKALQEHAVVMTTGDGAGGGKFIGRFIPAKFLGKMFPFSVGGIQLSTRTETPILPMFLVPISKTKWQTVIYPPLPVSSSMEEQLQPFITLLESYVVKYPGLWHFWDELDKRLEYAQQLVTEQQRKNEGTKELKNGESLAVKGFEN
jgi:KDO2-lipid IV(A) lauroyltransferase